MEAPSEHTRGPLPPEPPVRRRAASRGVVYLVLGFVVVATMAASGIRERDAGRDDGAAAEGDEIQFHYRLFDGRARLLYSTRADDVPELRRVQEQFDGPFALAATGEDRLQHYRVENEFRPVAFRNGTAVAFGHAFVGARVGDRLAFPVIGQVEGYSEIVTFDRLRGPFDRTMVANRTQLEATATRTADGGYLVANLFPARVLRDEGENVTLAIDAQPGTKFPIEQPQFTGEVVPADGGERFAFRVHTTVGHAFSLFNRCEIGRYVLPTGSYRVTAVDEDSVTLERSRTRNPQLIDRDLLLMVEIVDIVKSTEVEK